MNDIDIIQDNVISELDEWNIKHLFTEEQVLDIESIAYKNYYKYEMDITYAVKDAVATIGDKNGLNFPKTYLYWKA